MQIRSLLAGLASAVFFASPAGAGETAGHSEIRIGMVNALSGPASGLGKGMLEGAQAVFKEVNANGGVHGRKLSLVVADDGYEPDNTVEETLKMVQEQNVFSLFGYVGTPTTNAALPLIAELNVPLVGVFSGAMSLRWPVKRHVFNVRASYEDETEALVAHLLQQGAKSVAVMYQYDGFGLAVLSGTNKALAKRGSAVVATGTYQRNTVAIKSGLAAMVEAQPDAIVMVGTYAPIAAFIKAARAAGLRSQLATVSFVSTDDLVPLVGQDGNGVLISQVVPFPEDAGSAVARECRTVLAKHANAKLGFVNFEGCITARLMVAALERAGMEPTRQGLIEALDGMSALDLGGISVNLSRENHQAMSEVFLTQIRDGRIAKVR